MNCRNIGNIDHTQKTEDFWGNNIAVTCPLCGKVFIATTLPSLGGGKRTCPNPKCGKSRAVVTGGAKNGGTAYIELLSGRSNPGCGTKVERCQWDFGKQFQRNF
jgi:hypothetical protein